MQPVTWRELLTRTYRETIADDCLGMAAQLAFYFLLAVSPAILMLLALASFFPIHDLADEVGRVLGPWVSGEALTLIQREMQRLANDDNGGILTFGAAAAIWSSSAALVSIISSLNRAYDFEETRPWWKVRAIALGLTVILALMVLTSLSLLVAGPVVATYLGRYAGPAAEWAFTILSWPAAFVLVSTAIGIVYYAGPNLQDERRWMWISPGALAATTVWVLASIGFKIYVSQIGDYDASYGTAGAVVVLMLWFYVSGVALLIGAELNSEIAHAAKAAKPVPQPAAATSAASPAPRTNDAPRAGTRPLGTESPGTRDASAVPLAAGPAPGFGAVHVASVALASAIIGTRYWRRMHQESPVPSDVRPIR